MMIRLALCGGELVPGDVENIFNNELESGQFPLLSSFPERRHGRRLGGRSVPPHLQAFFEAAMTMEQEARAFDVNDETAGGDVSGLEVVALKHRRAAAEEVDDGEVMRALGVVGRMVNAQLFDQIVLKRHLSSEVIGPQTNGRGKSTPARP